MAKSKTEKVSGITFTGLLAIMFIAFKLMNIITWSWWWVLIPLWAPFVITATIILIVGIVAFIKYQKQK